ncbi:G-protein coupled receptor Mth2-like isoform X1 [Daktulosphaira vitifoliae]|uniref:G-protein coupled receptor Mth2-like isoform X1 n=1 Tax=Daktulosphaira vitifoliae TaxID=58002 RepID=UPI0021A9F9C5|nr:G-protein coupled receptor Mth2-like isoform X1 [Daktulosphaira vitifoliae]
MHVRTSVFIVSILVSTFVNENVGSNISSWCKMNTTKIVPQENVTFVGDVLWTMELPPKAYPISAYRRIDKEYELCICEVELCVQKCCNLNQVFGKKGCAANNDTLDASFIVPKYVNGSGIVEEHESDRFYLVYAKPKCKAGKLVLDPKKIPKDNYRISDSGHLTKENGEIITAPDQYCVDNFITYKQVIPLLCFEEKINLVIPENNSLLIYKIAMFISLPFLMVTFFIYALIRELRNLQGKSLICHIGSLTIAYASSLFIQLHTESLVRYQNNICVILAYIIQFSFLASFFWLNVMCFDLWWTFSGCRPMRGRAKERDSKKFILHSIYAWGGPLIIFFITFYMELSTSLNSTEYQPDFGLRSCWFHTKTATLIYFYGPIGVILLANSLMFIHTALMILKHMREAKVLQGSESKKSVDHEKQKFLLYFKLFLVMGVNWLAEIISWAFDNQGHWWYVTDIGNALQGVLIFLIFVCKKRVLRLVNKKFCPGVEIVKSSTVVSNRTTSSTYTQSTVVPKDSVEMNTHLVSDFKA